MNSKYNIKELEEKLEKCRNMKLEDVTVDEINSIKIDKRKSSKERILDFISKNPYVFKVNERLIRISFFENGRTTDACLTNMLEDLYR